MSTLPCTCRCYPLTALHAVAGLMCLVAMLRTQPLCLLTPYANLHAGAGPDCCTFWLLCIQLLFTAELSSLQDLLIQEKEKLYVELKNILARQPGPEVAEQLSLYQVSSFAGGGRLSLQISEAAPQVCPRSGLTGAWAAFVGHACPERGSSHMATGCSLSHGPYKQAAASQGDMHFSCSLVCTVFPISLESCVYADALQQLLSALRESYLLEVSSDDGRRLCCDVGVDTALLQHSYNAGGHSCDHH